MQTPSDTGAFLARVMNVMDNYDLSRRSTLGTLIDSVRNDIVLEAMGVDDDTAQADRELMAAERDDDE